MAGSLVLPSVSARDFSAFPHFLRHREPLVSLLPGKPQTRPCERNLADVRPYAAKFLRPPGKCTWNLRIFPVEQIGLNLPITQVSDLD